MAQFTLSSLIRDTGRMLVAHAVPLAGLAILPGIGIGLAAALLGPAVGAEPTPEDPRFAILSLSLILLQLPALAAWCRICLNADGPLHGLGPLDGRATDFLLVCVKLFGC